MTNFDNLQLASDMTIREPNRTVNSSLYVNVYTIVVRFFVTRLVENPTPKMAWILCHVLGLW